MLKTLSLMGAALAMTAGAVVPTAPAMAQGRHYHRYSDYDRGDRYDRGYQQQRYYRGYNGYRGERCNSGTTGTIVGAIAGGLLGRTIDTRGDRTLGTVLGGAAGALAGHAVERSNNPGYCRR